MRTELNGKLRYITTNEIKKGDHFWLRNGWKADMMDNMKGNTRVAKVYGFETECGSVYSHDIVAARLADGHFYLIDYTPSQLKCKEFANSLSRRLVI